MYADRRLRLRIVISVFIAILLLAIFIERMSYRTVTRSDRNPASNERVIESCDTSSCAPETIEKDHKSQEDELRNEGALLSIPADASVTR